MKYVLYAVLVIALIIGIGSLIHLYKVSNKNKAEMAKYSNEVQLTASLGKTLVIYYSLTGKTKDIALQIQSLTNADLYEIKPKEEIKQGPSLYLTSKKQISSGEYPEIVKDVAFVIPNETECEVVKQQIIKSGGRLLSEVEVFDLYPNIQDNKKSIAYKLTFKDNSRTLTDEEVMQVFNKIINEVTSKCNVKLRD